MGAQIGTMNTDDDDSHSRGGLATGRKYPNQSVERLDQRKMHLGPSVTGGNEDSTRAREQREQRTSTVKSVIYIHSAFP